MSIRKDTVEGVPHTDNHLVKLPLTLKLLGNDRVMCFLNVTSVVRDEITNENGLLEWYGVDVVRRIIFGWDTLNQLYPFSSQRASRSRKGQECAILSVRVLAIQEVHQALIQIF